MATTSSELIQRYLRDAIASERAFESQLRSMAEEGDEPRVREVFAMHADETRRQHDRLTSRLRALGGSPSTAKGIIAHLFGSVSKAGQIGQKKEDRDTQNIIMAYAIEQSEVATYEALKVAAEAVGDVDTLKLAEEIQREEEMAAEKIWSLLPASARFAVERQTPGEVGRARPSDVSGMAGASQM